jgi:hypothetical protein
MGSLHLDVNNTQPTAKADIRYQIPARRRVIACFTEGLHSL